MTQTINKDEFEKAWPKEPTIKIVENIEDAKYELKRITDRTSGTIQDEATKVVGVVQTISFSPISKAKQAKCRALVPLLTATLYLHPIYSLIQFSNSSTNGPWVR